MTQISQNSTLPPPSQDFTPSDASSAQPADRAAEAVVAPALELIRAASEPAPLPDRWRFLAASRHWRLAQPAATVTADLRAMFPVDILQAAGILHRGHDQQLTLSPVFGRGKSVYRLVRNDQGQPDVLSARGSLHSRCVALDFARFEFPATDQRQEQVVLAHTDADVQILSALGLRALWMNGLERLTPAQATPLFHSGGVAEPRRRHWLLAGFQVETLSPLPRPLLAPVIYNLRTLEKRLQPASFASFTRVWQPTAMDLEAIREARAYHNRTAVPDLIRQSCRSSSQALHDFAAPRLPDPELPLGTALDRLRAAIETCRMLPLAEPVREALAQAELSYRATLRSRFEAEAARASDPFEAQLLYQTAELSEYVFHQFSVMQSARRVVGGPPSSGCPAVEEASLSERLRVGDQILKIHRALRRPRS